MSRLESVECEDFDDGEAGVITENGKSADVAAAQAAGRHWMIYGAHVVIYK